MAVNTPPPAPVASPPPDQAVQPASIAPSLVKPKGLAVATAPAKLEQQPAVTDLDQIALTDGLKINGRAISQTDGQVEVQLAHGVVTFPRSIFQSINGKDAAPLLDSLRPSPSPRASHRLPSCDALAAGLRGRAWGTSVVQIPATVVDNGQMRFVPYKSFRAATDYEVNVYGDPDAPAAVEIGIYRGLLNDADAKRNCIDFIASAMSDPEDAAAVLALDREKDLVVRGGLTVEVTPATDPDAYGGWWVSVYDAHALDGARATPAEIRQITVPRMTLTRTPTKTAPPLAPPVATASPAASASAGDTGEWQASDMQYARPGRGSGGVYVSGYTRKNGTYVHSYHRRG